MSVFAGAKWVKHVVLDTHNVSLCWAKWVKHVIQDTHNVRSWVKHVILDATQCQSLLGVNQSG